jgi:hypothetical protein
MKEKNIIKAVRLLGYNVAGKLNEVNKDFLKIVNILKI